LSASLAATEEVLLREALTLLAWQKDCGSAAVTIGDYPKSYATAVVLRNDAFCDRERSIISQLLSGGDFSPIAGLMTLQ
jgi:hypothetical protein